MIKHNVVHIEIPAKDPQIAGKFYEKLFGWMVSSVPGMNYSMWDAEEGPGGAFTEITQENPAGKVLLYIKSEDIEADLKKAASLGGKILSHRQEITNYGWFGLFKDPSGNTIALYTGMNPMADH